jgi:hypothetical protein
MFIELAANTPDLVRGAFLLISLAGCVFYYLDTTRGH